MRYIFSIFIIATLGLTSCSEEPAKPTLEGYWMLDVPNNDTGMKQVFHFGADGDSVLAIYSQVYKTECDSIWQKSKFTWDFSDATKETIYSISNFGDTAAQYKISALDASRLSLFNLEDPVPLHFTKVEDPSAVSVQLMATGIDETHDNILGEAAMAYSYYSNWVDKLEEFRQNEEVLADGSNAPLDGMKEMFSSKTDELILFSNALIHKLMKVSENDLGAEEQICFCEIKNLWETWPTEKALFTEMGDSLTVKELESRVKTYLDETMAFVGVSEPQIYEPLQLLPFNSATNEIEEVDTLPWHRFHFENASTAHTLQILLELNSSIIRYEIRSVNFLYEKYDMANN